MAFRVSVKRKQLLTRLILINECHPAYYAKHSTPSPANIVDDLLNLLLSKYNG